jgi:hypothetical protein
MFGETLLGTLVNLLPIKATLGFKFLAIVTAFGSIAMSLYVLGFSKAEIKRVGRFLITGTVMTYAILLRVLGKGAVGATIAARTMGAKTSELRAARAERRSFEAQALAKQKRQPHKNTTPHRPKQHPDRAFCAQSLCLARLANNMQQTNNIAPKIMPIPLILQHNLMQHPNQKAFWRVCLLCSNAQSSHNQSWLKRPISKAMCLMMAMATHASKRVLPM